MKADLDRLMSARGLDVIFVACDHYFSAPRDYLTGGVAITSGFVLKTPGEAPVIFANDMEIEEAAKTGLRVVSFSELGWWQLLKDTGGDRTKAQVAVTGKCLEAVGVASGRVGIYGVGDLNWIVHMVELLRAAYPQFEWTGETGMTLFDEAFVTKDADEMARMRQVARATNEVLEETWRYLQTRRVEGETLLKEDGSPLTIGDVRRFVRKALLDRDLEDTGMIFAQGRDGGFPHSRGEDGMALRLGQSIVFDLFPREVGGGYHHDVTRTWCLGYAPDEVRQAYEEVMEAFDIAIEMTRPGAPACQVDEAVSDYFESKGHPTLRTAPGAQKGYVHSLGHGVGLNIHERPSISVRSVDTLQVGNVITIEPGLYYPERGFGVRIEDTVYIDGEGNVVSLTPFRKDLVIPLM